ncbi:MAG: type II toxin-antitoxin system HicB family antitoxin [Alphaproteobacteria bacterium]
MPLRSFSYPAAFTADAEDFLVVRFRDLPEALTSGKGEIDARRQASDCLDEAIANRIVSALDIPPPSALRKGERLVSVPAHTAAQAALYLAMREAGISKVELARRLACHESEARRLLDPKHRSKIERLEAALAVLGEELEIRLRKIA